MLMEKPVKRQIKVQNGMVVDRFRYEDFLMTIFILYFETCNVKKDLSFEESG
jgi:hypothetical protein